MIYKLQKKFIRICIISFLIVFTVIFSTIYFFAYFQATKDSDNIADIIMENDEQFPLFGADYKYPASGFLPNGIGPETPFTTRFFITRFDKEGNCVFVDTTSIVSITEESAQSYGREALQSNRERGWIDKYRFRVVSTNNGKSVIFINNDHFKTTSELIVMTAAYILIFGGLIYIAIVILLSKCAVKPVATSYEKQKQFITNANHELKTPLTLMLTNLDIVESELGKNEWIDDIRFEGNKMSELISKMVYLARMDEDTTELPKVSINLSEMVCEMIAVFQPLVNQKHLALIADVDPDIHYYGNDTSMRQLISVLTENAIKYCDANGNITVHLKNKKHPIFSIDNHYSAVKELDLDSLFERFYRADKARTTGSGFGIGLSVAKAIADKHDAKIGAQNINNTIIRFYVNL